MQLEPRQFAKNHHSSRPFKIKNKIDKTEKFIENCGLLKLYNGQILTISLKKILAN